MRSNTTVFTRLAVIAIAALGSASPAIADGKIKTVVELFTSQGCSSCPPADAILAELAQRDDVLALGYHVDYWDYLGWKDTLASPYNTQRQYDYRNAMGNKSVYTPQAVINGGNDAVGSRRSSVENLIKTTSLGTASVELKHGERSLDIILQGEVAKSADVTVIYFARATAVEIARGENRGKAINYANSVRSFKTIAMWEGGDDTIMLSHDELKKSGADGCAVIVQERTADGNPGRILAADRIYFDPA